MSSRDLFLFFTILAVFVVIFYSIDPIYNSISEPPTETEEATTPAQPKSELEPYIIQPAIVSPTDFSDDTAPVDEYPDDAFILVFSKDGTMTTDGDIVSVKFDDLEGVDLINFLSKKTVSKPLTGGRVIFVKLAFSKFDPSKTLQQNIDEFLIAALINNQGRPSDLY